MAAFDEFDWGALGKSILGGIGSAIGPGIVSYVGANQARRANQRAAQQFADSQLAGVRAIQAGNQAATGTLTNLQRQVSEIAAPGTAHLRGVATINPNALTPEQGIELGDQQRLWANQMQRTAGSGRTLVAMHNDLTNRTRARMLGENRNRQDTAAGTLHGMNAATIPTVARGVASIQAGEGRDVAQGTTNIGESTANATTANAEAANAALGTIGSVIAAEQERNRRKSRFEDWERPRA